MKVKATAVEITRKRGKLVMRLMNRTPRGTKYIKKELVMKAESMSDPSFKAEIATDLAKLVGSDAPTS